jgi:O-antigen/teichoic acid export membrane protein
MASDSPSPSPSLGAQAVWLLVAKTLGFALSIALPLVLVRRLSQVEFGLYKQVFLIVGSSVAVLPLGFGMSAFYYLPREPLRQGAVVFNILLFHALMGLAAALVIAIRPEVLVWMFNSPELADYAPWIALVLMLWMMGSFLEIITVAMKDVRATMGFIVASQFSKTLLLLIAAAVWGTVGSLIAAAVVHGVLQIAMLTVYLSARFPGFLWAFDWPLLRAQAVYALPVGASGLLLKLQDDVHHGFVSNAFGPAAYAIYAIGVFKLPLVGILRESVSSVVLPRINELETRNESRQILALVATSARKLALGYFAVYAALMVTGPDVISLLFTPQYLPSWPVFAISLTMLPFSILILDPVTRAVDQRFYILGVRVVTFAVMVGVLWMYAARLGLTGVIAVVVAAYLIGWVVAVRRMAVMLHMTRADLRLFAGLERIALAAGLAALLTAVVRSAVMPAAPAIVLAACLPVFGLTYVAVIAGTGVLRPSELTALASEVVRAVWSRRREPPAAPAIAATPVAPATRGVDARLHQ